MPSFAAIAGVAGVLAAGLIRDDVQAYLALARVGEQPPSSTPTSLPVRTTGELDRAVGRLLLVTIAEVRLEDATLRCHRLREVCDPYMRMPFETAASVASPTDDVQERARR